MRTTTKRRVLQVPSSIMSPHGVLKLVLNIEQPDTDRSSKQHDRDMHEEECADADEPYYRGDESHDGDIGPHRAEPGHPPITHEPDRNPVLHDKQISRTEAEHDKRVSVDAVTHPTPTRPRKIFTHGQRVHVADSAAIKIA